MYVVVNLGYKLSK